VNPARSHSLRHSHAALLIEQGVHAKAIQARLGHGDIRTTLQLYGHLFEGYDETAAEAMDNAFADNTRTKAAPNVL
jgi:site-specific recombinase XerD